jgi:DNA integrity scanning protein DisA with diadenylate cyclase activity
MGLWDTITGALDQFGPTSVIEILGIAALIYLLLLLLKDTTAMSLLRGIIIVVIVAVILTQAFELTVLSWLLRNSFPALIIAFWSASAVPDTGHGQAGRCTKGLSTASPTPR